MQWHNKFWDGWQVEGGKASWAWSHSIGSIQLSPAQSGLTNFSLRVNGCQTSNGGAGIAEDFFPVTDTGSGCGKGRMKMWEGSICSFCIPDGAMKTLSLEHKGIGTHQNIELEIPACFHFILFYDWSFFVAILCFFTYGWQGDYNHLSYLCNVVNQYSKGCQAMLLHCKITASGEWPWQDGHWRSYLCWEMRDKW